MSKVDAVPETQALDAFIRSTNGTCDDQYAIPDRLVPIAERSFSGSTGRDGTVGVVGDGVGVAGDGVGVVGDGVGVVGDAALLPDGVGVVGVVVAVPVGVLFCPGGMFPAGFVFPVGVAVIPEGELVDEPFGGSLDTWVPSSESAP